MDKVTFAVLGMGNRGRAYSGKHEQFDGKMEVVAIADNRRKQLDSSIEQFNLKPKYVFNSADELLSQPKLADIMIIATQDGQHKEHALRALELGYDLLLEKPIAATLEDCIAITKKAEELGRRVIICHVLRYSPFYKKIKELIDEGVVGDIESVHMREGVGYYHIAHSYVRGNWHNLAQSSPIILAKTCHDLDLMVWLTGEKCLALNSFGSLNEFKAENCPEGATDRCTDGCPYQDTCPYDAPSFYLSRIPGWPTQILNPEPTPENIMEALRTTNYGRCVYKMDNDVCDHQTVNLQMTKGITISFHLSGFTAVQDRHISVMGNKGEIWGDFHSGKVHYQRFRGPEEIVDVTGGVALKGHGGGDAALLKDVIELYTNPGAELPSITTIGRSLESHMMAFAAEQSRLEGGELIKMDEFAKANGR